MEKECIDRINRIENGFNEMRQVFIALGDETRQAIIIAILDGDPTGMRVGEIAKFTYLSRPAVSHHLQFLKDAGIIKMRKEGTKNFYYINTESKLWEKLVNLFTDIRDNVHHLEK